MHIDSSRSNPPSFRQADLVTHLGLAVVSVAISASLIGGLLGLFEQRAGRALTAAVVAPAVLASAGAGLVDCSRVASAASTRAE